MPQKQGGFFLEVKLPLDMNSSSFDELVARIAAAWPSERWAGYGVVVAVSGGADSVALLRALAAVNEPACNALTVAHFHHGLRGAEADADAAFVRELASQLELPFYCEHAEHAEGRPESTSENALREQRYAFLVEVARKNNCRYVATAHHRDDQVETLLFRLCRGTGVRGLGGIPLARVVEGSISLIRPLLDVPRKLIVDALRQLQQPWRNDASNDESDYARNYLRNEVLPLLRERFPQVDESVARLSKQAVEQQAFLTQLAETLLESVSESEGEIVFDCERLGGTSAVLLRELVALAFRRADWPAAEVGFRELDELARFIGEAKEVKRKQFVGGIDCQSDGRKLRLWR